jgi:hypothetical protein
MRSITFVVVLAAACFCSTYAFAGKIFGDIGLEGKPLPAGVKLLVTRPGTSAVADSTTTDKFGSYKLLVKGEGKSVLTVLYDGKRLDLAVFSNKEATRYDLVVEKKDGKLTLRRK